MSCRTQPVIISTRKGHQTSILTNILVDFRAMLSTACSWTTTVDPAGVVSTLDWRLTWSEWTSNLNQMAARDGFGDACIARITKKPAEGVPSN